MSFHVALIGHLVYMPCLAKTGQFRLNGCRAKPKIMRLLGLSFAPALLRFVVLISRR